MKTSEFKRRLEDSGFSVELIGANLKEFQILYDGFPRGYILEDFPYQMNTTYYFKEMEDNLRILLLDTMYEYARTPVEDREEEKRYKLKHRFLKTSSGYSFLSVNNEDGVVYLGGYFQAKGFQSNFTEKEIDEIKKKFNTTLDGFEMIEVWNEY